MMAAFDGEDIGYFRARLAEAIMRHLPSEGTLATPIAGLTLHHRNGETEPGAFLYEPAFALIATGTKRVVLGNDTYVYDQSRFLLTAVGLPTVVQVLNATPARPYLSIKLDIDLDLARALIADVDRSQSFRSPPGAGLAIGEVTGPLVAATLRLVELLDAPADISILAASIQREILYRVLNSTAGARLRQAVELGTQTQKVSAAIQWIRDNFDSQLRIEELARVSGLGQSTLHHHFRLITSMTPLQYQKQLRLHEARRLMIADHLDAGTAARRVGYDSATQFNREYRRLFGMPPKRDVAAILTGRHVAPGGTAGAA